MPLGGPHKSAKHALSRQKLLLYAAVAAVVSYIMAMRVALLLQTGSVWYQNYDWYNPHAAAQRMHPDTPVSDHSAECLLHGRSAYPDVQCPASQRKITVHVLPQSKDFLPWIWHTVLATDTDDKADMPVHFYDSLYDELQPRTKSFPSHDIDFIIEPFPLQPARAALITNLLVVGEHLNHTYLSLLPRHARVGLIILGYEDCRNIASHGKLDYRIAFGFVTYGDCALVDGVHWRVWPLGPRTLSGFPARMHPRSSPRMAERTHDLNMVMTYTLDKPSRMQAWLATQPWCEGWIWPQLSCHTGVAWFAVAKIIEAIDRNLGTQLSGAFLVESAARSYVDTLKKSKLTLSPSGKNPEQYRIYEAIMAGSVPVVEDPEVQPGTFLHPSYPATFRCMPDDIHRVIKATRAPVIYVRDWETDLDRILAEMSDQQLQEKQDALAAWYDGFVLGLRDEVLCQVRAHMSESH